jgi:hypothetical protein
LHKKHIVIVSAVYPPEPAISAVVSKDLAEELLRCSFKVTVLCPQPSRPAGADYGEFVRAKAAEGDGEGGVKVVRLGSFSAPWGGLWAKARESVSFGLCASKYLEGVRPPPDVIYANVWPVFAQAFMGRWAHSNGVPLVLHIQDVYPESWLRTLHPWSATVVSKPLIWLDRWIARQAARLVVVSDGVRNIYVKSRGITPDKVITVQNWFDDEGHKQIWDKATSFRRYEVEAGRFTFMFLGNVGHLLPQNLKTRSC